MNGALGFSPLRAVESPYTLDDLLTDEFDLDRAVTRLASAQAS